MDHENSDEECASVPSQLPYDTACIIAQYLDSLQSFYNLFCTCSTFSKMAKSAFMWNRMHLNVLIAESRKINEELVGHSIVNNQQKISKRNRLKNVNDLIRNHYLIIQRMTHRSESDQELMESSKFALQKYVFGRIQKQVLKKIETLLSTTFDCSCIHNNISEENVSVLSAEDWLIYKYNSIFAELNVVKLFPASPRSHFSVNNLGIIAHLLNDSIVVCLSDKKMLRYGKIDYDSISFEQTPIPETTINYILECISKLMNDYNCRLSTIIKNQCAIHNAIRTQSIRIVKYVLEIFNQEYRNDNLSYTSSDSKKIKLLFNPNQTESCLPIDICLEIYKNNELCKHIFQLLENNYPEPKLNLFFLDRAATIIVKLPNSEIKRLFKQYNLPILNLDAECVIKNILTNNCNANVKDASEMIEWFLQNGLKLENTSPLLLPFISIIQKQQDAKSQDEFIRIARMMMQYGADVNTLNEYHDCALMTTLQQRGKFSLRFARFLIENGADCNLQRARGSILVNFCLLNPDEEFDLEKIALLVENGADVNWMGKVIKYGYYEITDINPIRALFIEENKRSYDSMIRIIEYLVAHGGNLNMLDANGLNLIEWYNIQTGSNLNHTRNKRVLQYFFNHE